VSVLVAGVGNMFFSDDGFGPEVIRALSCDPIDGAKVEDFGIRGMHLAYELLAGYERAILVDAVARGGAPGTLYVIEPDVQARRGAPDAHGMDLQNVFAFVRVLGGEPPPVTLVGCEPGSTDEGIGLSDAVARSVPMAVEILRKLVEQSSAPMERRPEREMKWSEV
jgi:hydrogenase maturation protease